MQKKIVTSYIFPPIPLRNTDWLAHYEGEEEKQQYGYGKTAAEAIADLQEMYPEDDD